MDITQILALYDEEQRKLIEIPGLRREATPRVIRHVDLIGTEGLVLYSELDDENVDDVIREQIDYFEKLGHAFEWKYYEHDVPPDLKSRLMAHGFETEETEAIVVLDLESIPAKLLQPSTHDVRRITDTRRIMDAVAVQNEVWQSDRVGLAERLTCEIEQTPESFCLYVAYADERPVCSAWIRFSNASQFASLWGGSTLSAYRRRGIYTAMLGVRAQEALRRGARFLTVDASPMSRPILEKLGFQLLTLSTPCKWYFKRAKETLT
jgi:hypothetical protein